MPRRLTPAIVLAGLLVAAVAAPVAVHYSLEANTGYRTALARYTDLKRQQRAVDQYGAQVGEYNRFAARVEQFVTSARKAGVTDEAWDRHHVDIKQRHVTFAELDKFIAGAASGENYYFLPSKLVIQAPDTGAVENPFRRGLRTIARDGVRVSLEGDFLVRIR